ncbi:fibronectin type III domain-containing protein [Microbacterium trichothecenolyticum]|uniref:Calcineurin-like phosphoesterase n=1 Tax=Microbacterium trichothecenolyticum TaxID=69370 RepID=A0ABU0TU48_MICTR|nr:fibronectin type III domain-containing protein [Microbacterium trichothecenolyticum]MDQ1123188.1 hypothetical protein [Microbacterium trichothecenolyticum]
MLVSARPTAVTAGAIALAIGLSSFGGGVAVAAGGGLAPPAVDPASVHRPTAAPDRIVLTPTTTPQVSQAVSWRTSTEVTAPRIEWAASGPGLVSGASSAEAVSSTRVDTTLGYPVMYHSAVMTGLEAGATYVYRVGDGDSWSEWLEFRTASAEPGDFSFIVQGDAQNDNKAYTSRAFRAAFEARPYAKLAVHVGDLVDTETSDAEWGEWHGAGALVNQYANVIATPGNHEYYPGPDLTAYWPAQFSFPQNGPAIDALDETVYSVDYQGVRFVALNSNAQDAASLQAQTTWLDAVLTDNPQEWTVVTFHHPVFSNSSGRDNAAIRQAWLPVLEKHDVDLVVQGHDHTYGRGNLVSREQGLPAGADPAHSHTGPVYMVTVAGPKKYDLAPAGDNNWTQNGANRRAAGEDRQMYQTVDVTGDGRMHVEAHSVDGVLFDAFTITKDADGSKLVTDDAQWVGGAGSTREGVNAPPAPTPTPTVTPSPTATPTPIATPSPTGSPTVRPTDVPTATPTVAPTVAPTTAPTGAPGTGSESEVLLSTREATPGSALRIEAGGFAPGEHVSIELHSTPVLLGTATADDEGRIRARVSIPADAEPGEHRIVLVGATSARTVGAPLTITRSASAPPIASGLAATGSALPVTLMVLGAALVAAGGAIVLRFVLRNRKAS